MREIKAKVGNVGARLKMNGMCCVVMACLFVNDTVSVLFAKSGG